jgi:hypothetical protein
MNEEELKALIGETAFNAMSADQRTGLMGKFQKSDPPKSEPPKSDPPKPDPKTDPDLGDRARAAREAAERESDRTKRLESSIRFTMGAPDFLKKNESLLPKEVADIFTQAEKENFADAIEKDSAIKSGLIQSFFSVQANVDLLTAGQKATLDDYLKLTKNGKQEKAQAIYDMVFEPAFEMLKRVKKAEALSRGHGSGSDSENAYKNKLIGLSRKHYLGEKDK